MKDVVKVTDMAIMGMAEVSERAQCTMHDGIDIVLTRPGVGQ